ncbi:MAG: hypothetical protein GXY83_31975 [Rhodopirellula sp.]|nr:hypothetical protein [Rhodopirellula sp.]
MKSQSFSEDPQAELPDCFRNEAHVEKLVKGLKNLKKGLLSAAVQRLRRLRLFLSRRN